MRKMKCLAGLCGLLLCAVARAQTTQSAENAVPLYTQAGKMILTQEARSPSLTDTSGQLTHPYPPYPARWMDLEKAAYAVDGPVRDLVHQAASIDSATWDDAVQQKPGALSQLTLVRLVANEVADAASYEDTQGDEISAIGRLNDLMHLADLLDNNAVLVRLLVGEGIDAVIANRIQVIASDIHLSADGVEAKALSVDAAKKLINRLVDVDLVGATNTAWHRESMAAQLANGAAKSHLDDTAQRVMMERDFAAMTLAIHLYYFDHKTWPAKADDFASYLPKVPTDPWNDNKPLGYVLLKGGLPDGGDRPLVYSHLQAADGLAYRVDSPQYGYYLMPNKKMFGQFRDVTRWTQAEGAGGDPQTRPLPE